MRPSLSGKERRESDIGIRNEKQSKKEREFKKEKKREKRPVWWCDIGKKKDIKRGGISPPKRFGWRPCRRAKNEGGSGENTKRETI